MDWQFFGVIATLTGAFTVVTLVRVIAFRLKQGSGDRPSLQGPSHEVVETLSNMEDRLSRLEERLDFNERLLRGRNEPAETQESSDP